MRSVKLTTFIQVAALPEYTRTWSQIVNTTHNFTLPCRGLTDILTSELGSAEREVDFLTIDVQGAEEEVLQTAYLGKLHREPTMFKVVLVEAESTAMAKNARVKAMLESAGLVKLKHEVVRPFHASYNELFVRPSVIERGDPRPSQHRTTGLQEKGRLARFLDGVTQTPELWYDY